MPRKVYPRKKFQRRYRKPGWMTGGNRLTSKIVSPGYMNGQIYRFKRKRTSTISITMNASTTESHGAFVFMLDDLPAKAEFTALFDKYRIAGIRAQFLPRTNVLSQANLTGSLTEVPPIITVIDYDDASGTDDYNSLMQYENAKVHSEFKPFSLYFKPMVAVGTYNGTFGGYGSSRKMWIDAASSNVQYYSLKWATLNYAIGNNVTPSPAWDVVFTYYVQCKYPR